MLVIKVELWPGGQTKEAVEIGRAFIFNDGTGDLHHANYNIGIMGRPDAGPFRDYVFSREVLRDAQLTGYIERFPRGPSNLWPLIKRALNVCNIRRRVAEGKNHGDR